MSPPLELQEFTLAENLNHPANIRAIYAFAADLFNQPLKELAHRIELNFQRLFAPCRTTARQSQNACANSSV